MSAFCRGISLFWMLGLAICLPGCGRSDGKIDVRGLATWNGDPIANGYVELQPTDGKGQIVGAGIVNGIESHGQEPSATTPLTGEEQRRRAMQGGRSRGASPVAPAPWRRRPPAGAPALTLALRPADRLVPSCAQVSVGDCPAAGNAKTDVSGTMPALEPCR